MKDKTKGLFYRKYTIEKTLAHHVIEWLATAGSLGSAILVAMHFRDGYLMWVVANILWCFFSFKHKHWGLFFLSACYLVVYLYAFFNW